MWDRMYCRTVISERGWPPPLVQPMNELPAGPRWARHRSWEYSYEYGPRNRSPL